MAQSGGFNHITVTAAEEEDEVILAGVASSDEEPVAPEVAAEPEPVVVAEPEPAPAAEPEPEPAVHQAAAVKPAKSQSAGAARKARDEYHETTLEDLQSTPMPMAQRIVIIAAIILVIVAIVYYFVAMR